MTQESHTIHLINKLFSVVSLLEKTGNSIFEHVGLTVSTYAILSAIEAGHTRSTDLAYFVHGTLPSITRKTKILEKEGYIKRTVDAQDKRVWLFSLTSKGVKALHDVQPLYADSVSKLFTGITKQEHLQIQEVLEEIEKRLISNFEQCK